MPGLPSIRAANPSDAADISRIYDESIQARDSTMDTEPFSPGDVISLLGALTSRETLLVIESGGTVQGWGIVKKYSERPGYHVACETSVYLDRSMLRQGLGTRLQHALLKCARESGFHHVVAKIWAENASSIAFHEACGFRLVGIQREIGLVDNVRRDVAIMERLLNHPSS